MHEHRQEIRFSDIDAMGHVNNAVYLNYLEQARISFFRAILGRPWDWNAAGIIVGRNTIDYMAPIKFNDNIVIRTYVTRVGTKSFNLTYEVLRVFEDGEQLCSKAESVMVCFDYHSQQTIEVPPLWREYFQKVISEVPK
ncbi:MAG: thioesterase family protein [Flavobacteriales bacterium]|nr:thioesterase family protein [Flavobacteriales bacterium]